MYTRLYDDNQDDNDNYINCHFHHHHHKPWRVTSAGMGTQMTRVSFGFSFFFFKNLLTLLSLLLLRPKSTTITKTTYLHLPPQAWEGNKCRDGASNDTRLVWSVFYCL